MTFIGPENGNHHWRIWTRRFGQPIRNEHNLYWWRGRQYPATLAQGEWRSERDKHIWRLCWICMNSLRITKSILAFSRVGSKLQSMEKQPWWDPAILKCWCRAGQFTARKASKARSWSFGRDLTLRECTKPCKSVSIRCGPRNHQTLKISMYLILVWRYYRFFNDVFSKGGFGGVWHTLRAFYDGDAYLAIPLRSQFIDQTVSA